MKIELASTLLNTQKILLLWIKGLFKEKLAFENYQKKNITRQYF